MFISYSVSISLQVRLSIRKISLWGALYGILRSVYWQWPNRRFGTTYRSYPKVAKKPNKFKVGLCWLLKMGRICCTETLVRHCHHTQRNIPQERRSHLLRSGSLKLKVYLFDKICHLVFSRLKHDLNIIFYFLNMYHSLYSQILFSFSKFAKHQHKSPQLALKNLSITALITKILGIFILL